MPELVASNTLSRNPLTIEMFFYRRDPSAPHFLEDAEGRKPGTVFREYIETWVRKSAEGEPMVKERLAQVHTRGAYEYVSYVPAEAYDEDPTAKAFVDSHDYIVSYQDFSFYCFKKVALLTETFCDMTFVAHPDDPRPDRVCKEKAIGISQDRVFVCEKCAVNMLKEGFTVHPLDHVFRSFTK